MKIVHLDLKSLNILIGDDEEPILSDFGLSLDCNDQHFKIC
jgi:serine/threonine protein kinase